MHIRAMRRGGVAMLALLLSACAGQVSVPSVRVQTPSGLTPICGKYAAMVQSGGWRLNVAASTWTCSAWKFDADVNGPYERAMREALTKSLESVEFVAETYPPERLRELGYDAEIVLYQGNASSDFSIQPRFLSSVARGDIRLSITLAVLDERGLGFQQTITGKGGGRQELFTCDRASEALGRAAQDAIGTIVKDAALQIREALRDRQLNRAAGK